MYAFDARTDIRKAAEIGRGHYALFGNLDPAILAGADPETVRSEVKALLALFRDKGGLMIGPGCALGPNTPSANYHALVEVTKQFG